MALFSSYSNTGYRFEDEEYNEYDSLGDIDYPDERIFSSAVLPLTSSEESRYSYLLNKYSLFEYKVEQVYSKYHRTIIPVTIKENKFCSICLSDIDYDNNNLVFCAAICGNLFHHHCINSAKIHGNSNFKCPNCRSGTLFKKFEKV